MRWGPAAAYPAAVNAEESTSPAPRAFACNLCEALCGLHVTVAHDRVLAIRGNPDDVFSRGHICPKGPALRELREDPDRLRTPLRRRPDGSFEAVSWDLAMGEIAARLRAIRRAHGRDAVGYYVGNPVVHSHRASLGSQVLQLALGTRNRFDPNSQDSNPRLFAAMQVHGDGLAMPVPDIDRTDLLIVLGANPAVTGGSQMGLGDVRARLRGVRERGGRVVVFDPRRTETVELAATEHHVIRPGGDAALLLAMLHELFERGRIDEAATARIAGGLEALREAASRFAPERVSAAIGVAPATIRELANALADTPRAVVYGRLGACQSAFGPLVMWLVEALNAVTGHLDREGCAMFPAPAADIGPLARRLVGNRYGRWRSRVRGLPEFLGSLPSSVMAEEMETPGSGQIRALVCLAGNPVLSVPNGPRLERALGKLDLVVAVDLYLNETSRHAHYVLPTAHVFESGNYDLVLLGLTVRNVARYSPPIVARAGDTRDDWEICSELAIRLLPGVRHLRRLVLRLSRRLPERLIDWLLRRGRYRLRLERLAREPNGVDLGPLKAGELPRRVHTPDGRLRLAPEPLLADLPRLEAWLDAPREPLVLIGRRHLRDNNSWMHNLPSLASGKDRATLWMHPRDAASLGLSDGVTVEVTSRTGSLRARLEVRDAITPGVVSLPHGYGHASARDRLRVAGALPGESVNAITDELLVEPVIGTSILNGVPVSVRPATRGRPWEPTATAD
ncbi:MAG: molybdopterin-dependent oxidoreductase [Deltaproteobacteria bacterium]|nr:molybdopterin-dependent oxidoreductase [Deltaproteobacteria bacterium]MCB9788009.1 molybdopterin-dependent oxidoreductase [Deltaproteobacteria bacterium]